MKKISDALKKATDSIAEKTRLDKKLLAIMALAFAGIIALMLSEVVPQEKKAEDEPQSESQTQTDYAAETEAKLKDILSAIEGAGRVKVMVTLESSGEEIYLRDTSLSSDGNDKSGISSDEVNKYIIVDNGDGESGIVAKVISPKIRGVAVVCDGGSSTVVRAAITQTVTALLNISSARVSVTKMN